MEYRENRDVRRPFLAIPDARVYFPAAAIERARRTTERCLRRGEGIALVVGATGVGKTILARVLAASFETDDLTVVATPTRKNNVKSFLQQILFGLRQTYCGCDETELRLMTLDYLARSASRRFVLIVDDAQNLSLPVFDEIRVLVDQGSATSAQISVALIGTNRLEERLNLPRLYPIQQRIAVRSYLEAFDRAEINDYIDGETRRVGWPIRFSSDAKKLIAELSDGSPRVVNQLSDRAALLAFGEAAVADGGDWANGVDRGNDADWTSGGGFNESANFNGLEEIGRNFVERAWANLLNLPEEDDGDATNDSNGMETNDVVEFGTLDDEEFSGFDDYNASGDGQNVDARDGFDDFSENFERETRFAEEIRNAATFRSANNGKKSENAASLTEDCPLNGGKSLDGENWLNGGDLLDDESSLGDKEQETREEYNVSVDWEAERYGGFEAIEFENNEKTVDRFSTSRSNLDETAAGAEIDAELEARLLAKFGVARNETSETSAGFSDFSDNNDDAERGGNADFDENDADVGVQLDENFEKVDVKGNNDEQNVELEDERNAQRQVYNALKTKNNNENGELFEIQSQTDVNLGENIDENDGNFKINDTKNEFSSLFPKTKTRRLLSSNDDGSREFERVNGFSADEGDFRDENERFWEANLSSDSVFGKAVYSENEEKSLNSGFQGATRDVDEFLSLEERAYRQIVDVCRDTFGEFGDGDRFLTELVLLEQEIEKDSDLIRRIREIRTRRRGAGNEETFDLNDSSEKNDYWGDAEAFLSVQETE